MADGLFIAAAGAVARQHQLDALSDNLANLSTDGYRATRVAFETMLANSASGQTYVRPAPAKLSSLEGAIRTTDRALDAAIDGDGFFAVEIEGADAPRLTRLGRFEIDASGRLVTPDGHAVLGTGGPISGLRGEVRIEADGKVYAGEELKGRLRMIRFEDPSALVKQGQALFAAPDTIEPIETEAKLIPRSIEGSNVNAVAAMTELVRVQRAFESANKAIETYRQMDRQLVSDVASR